MFDNLTKSHTNLLIFFATCSKLNYIDIMQAQHFAGEIRCIITALNPEQIALLLEFTIVDRILLPKL